MFGLGKEETQNINEWLEEHDKTCTFLLSKVQPASGGRLTYCFTPMGLGLCTVVECACGKKKDVTNFEDW